MERQRPRRHPLVAVRCRLKNSGSKVGDAGLCITRRICPGRGNPVGAASA